MGAPDLRSRMLAAFQNANPGLSVAMPPQPDPGASMAPASVQRVIQSGGELAARMMHPAFVPFESLFRKLPASGIFTATPQANVVMELGSFTVPQQMVFALVDYRFDIYRLSGAAAGDWIPLEDRRLSAQISYDVVISNYRTGNLSFELDPTPNTASQSAYEPAPTAGIIAAGAEFNLNQPPQIGNPFFPPSSGPRGPTATDFANAQAAASSGPSGAGLSNLPQRHERQGALPLPWMMLVRESQRVQFKAIARRAVPIPLAFFEVDVTGVLMPANVLDSLLAEMAPFAPQGRP